MYKRVCEATRDRIRRQWADYGDGVFLEIGSKFMESEPL